MVPASGQPGPAAVTSEFRITIQRPLNARYPLLVQATSVVGDPSGTLGLDQPAAACDGKQLVPGADQESPLACDRKYLGGLRRRFGERLLDVEPDVELAGLRAVSEAGTGELGLGRKAQHQSRRPVVRAHVCRLIDHDHALLHLRDDEPVDGELVLQVASGGESTAGAGDDHRTQTLVEVDGADHLFEFGDHRRGDRVEPVGAVEGDAGDAVGLLVRDVLKLFYGLPLDRHDSPRCLSAMKPSSTAAHRCGCSRCGVWPAPGITIRRRSRDREAEA